MQRKQEKKIPSSVSFESETSIPGIKDVKGKGPFHQITIQISHERAQTPKSGAPAWRKRKKKVTQFQISTNDEEDPPLALSFQKSISSKHNLWFAKNWANWRKSN